jgi:two-component system response regulator
MMNALATILLVEDSDDDAELTERTLEESRLLNPIVRARDGVEALQILGDADPLPALVLLDLRLPRLGGVEVLREIRANGWTRLLPVVVLTSSSADHERLAGYAHHATSFMTKPMDLDRFLVATRQLGLCWGILPRPPGDGGR